MENHTVVGTGTKCEKCSKEFLNGISLTNHISLVHKGTLKCTQCDKEYKTTNSLKRHDLESEIHGKRLLDCVNDFNSSNI